MRRFLIISAIFAVGAIGLVTAYAGPFTADPLTLVSGSGVGTSPFTHCTADNVAAQPGRNFPDSEVEPWVDVNPRNSLNIVGSWQQDRWSNGGSRGLVAGVSFDGGAHWTNVVIPRITLCSGGTPANGGDYKRGSDPWLSFAPNGDLFHVSLSFDFEAPPGFPGAMGKNALLVSRSLDGGVTWSDPVTIIKDTSPRILNDKEAITADPGNSNFVYLVWDRVESPVGTLINPEKVIGLGFKSPATFSRTTNGGVSWEVPSIIYDPGANNQTIGNQIVVLPNGTLVDFFNELLNFRNDEGGSHLDFNLSLKRSSDRGVTWLPHGPPIRAAKMQSRAVIDPQLNGVRDPDTGARVRTGDILPQVAVDRNPRSPGFGNLYAVWQDARFSSFAHDSIAFSMSRDGGFTWSTPIQINRTPTNIRSGDQQAFTPTVRAAADGTIGVTYYDFRNTTPCPIVSGRPDCTGVSLKTDSANWASEARITPASFDMRKAPVARGFFVGDYEALAVIGNEFKPFFVQSGIVTGDPSDVFFTSVGP
ncbi:MAG: hypothetical protein AUH81_01455 [Candidatus Rokubacteria bacterium 13_1_40CM_4_69_5]|nr:MAG: hypothetical protein AUH81_01455 [Candidatus Rokubacteria bacterium 13_1_40CM_4_69_5]